MDEATEERFCGRNYIHGRHHYFVNTKNPDGARRHLCLGSMDESLRGRTVSHEEGVKPPTAEQYVEGMRVLALSAACDLPDCKQEPKPHTMGDHPPELSTDEQMAEMIKLLGQRGAVVLPAMTADTVNPQFFETTGVYEAIAQQLKTAAPYFTDEVIDEWFKFFETLRLDRHRQRIAVRIAQAKELFESLDVEGRYEFREWVNDESWD